MGQREKLPSHFGGQQVLKFPNMAFRAQNNCIPISSSLGHVVSLSLF